MSEQNDDSTTFLRQRRDLFVISSVLLLIPIAGIEISNQVAMQQFGISLKISRPEVIHYALWVLWAYWYIRYIQAYRALNQKFFINKYHSELSICLYPTFHSLATKEQDNLVNNDILANGAGFTFKKQSYRFLRSEYICEFTAYDPEYGSEFPISKTFTYSGLGYLNCQIKVILKCVIANMEATEYLLPFIFGISPLVYFLLGFFKLI
jgi:hypothetical protein